MTSMERTLQAIGHMEPDRVPLFLLFSLYGAKEAGVSVKDYFSHSEKVVKTQLYMREKYKNDCYYTFSYAAAEVEAFGGEVVFVEKGTPVSGEPVIASLEHLERIEKTDLPDIKNTPCLSRVLATTESLNREAKGEVPIIGVVMSPFSLPVMQMGFEKYLELLYFRRELWEKLMRFNEAFCVAWANAQLEAGATAICYFDPLASPAMIDVETYRQTGFLVAKRTIGAIKGPVATHLASGISLPVVEDIKNTGSLVLGCSAQDDLSALKKQAKGKICLLGNLNGLEMIGWSEAQAEEKVRSVIEQAGEGGGLLLGDNHGEIPFQVPEKVLQAISDAVHVHGRYPLQKRDRR